MGAVIKVGMADYKICRSPDAVTTLGLGSCVGIALWDREKKIGGLVHVMLPSSTAVKLNSNPLKFADTGIDELVKQMVLAGASKNNLVAKIAGGAQMFNFQQSSATSGIGERNVEAAKDKLNMLRIPILASDTGENYGRTVTFYPENGNFAVRAVGKSEKVI